MRRRLFALDQNFPEPIVSVLTASIAEAELVPLRLVDERLPRIDDWRLLLALHHDKRPWDGLITTDTNMLALPREMSVLLQTKLTLVATSRAGHDPLRATGLLLTHLPYICGSTRPDTAQLWVLSAVQKSHDDPWKQIEVIARRKGTTAKSLYALERLSETEFATNPLTMPGLFDE